MRTLVRITGVVAAAALTIGVVPVAASDGPPGTLSKSGIAAKVHASAVRNAFGGAVAVGDGEVFVGEAQNSFRPGAVYVYRKTGAAWKQVSVLNAPKAEYGDPFGAAMVVNGSNLYVSAGPSAVHVFHKTGTTWTFASTIAASQAGGSAKFGNALAVSGDWLFIGEVPAQRTFNPAGGRGGPPAPVPNGAVYAFRRNGSQYSFHSTITRPDTAGSADAFGTSVDVEDGILLIGATGISTNAGVVYEFALGADGKWQSKRTFTPGGVGNNDLFGGRIALHDHYAVVSAANDAGGYGAAYVFHKIATMIRNRDGSTTVATGVRGAAMRDDSTWVEVARLTASTGARMNRFGSAVAITDRDVFAVTTALDFNGAVYAFARDTIGVKSTPSYIPTGLTGSGGPNMSIDARGNVLAVGAPVAERNRGAVMIYERNAAGTWVKQTVLHAAMDELTAMTGRETKCDDTGHVGPFECGNSSLVSFLPPSKLTADGHYTEMNDLWGWTDPVTKKEWALMGRMDGTTFVDISDPMNPVPVADLPLTAGARPAAWRDIKVYKDHAFIVSDGAGDHGMQVFDLKRLRTLKPVGGRPVLVKFDTVYHQVHSVHNIVINEESGFAYAVGSSSGGTTCGGGLHMIDIHEPKNPQFAGCFSDTGTGRSGTGYSHDAQCVMYHGPHQKYSGHEICIGSNETAISIADVTDKKNPKALSHASYPNNAYAHQGWFTEDQKYFFLDDELDELDHPEAVNKTRTLVWDLSDLENPRLVKEYMGVQNTTDHNLYVLGKQVYQANYLSGLRILDVSDPENPREVSFFDTAPFHPNAPGFDGAWSVYPYFKSGNIVVNSISQGMFIIKQSNRVVF
jgi:choice-of-anchor B domain-containing protein